MRSKKRTLILLLLFVLSVLVLILSFSASQQRQTSQSRAAENLYPVPDSIPFDCSVDVTALLNAFIATVPDGSDSVENVITFKVGGCYKVFEKLLVTRRAFLRFDGQGATIQSYDVDNSGHQPAWEVYFSNHIYFEDMIVVGDNPRPSYFSGPPREWSHGFSFGGSHDVGVERVEIHNVYGDGVMFSPRWDGKTPVIVYNGYVRDSLIDGTGRMGIVTTAGHDFVWERNIIRNTPWVFDLELEWKEAGFGIENVTIRNNRTGLYRLVWFANAGQCGTHKNIVVKGNEMEPGSEKYTTWPAVAVQNPAGCARRGPYVFEDNILRVSGKYGAIFECRKKPCSGGGVADLLFQRNAVNWIGGYKPKTGVFVHNSDLIRILDNCFNVTPHVVVENVDSTNVSESGNRDCSLTPTPPQPTCGPGDSRCSIATPTPPQEGTPTPTKTPTPIPSPTSGPTPTAPPGQVSLSLLVKTQGVGGKPKKDTIGFKVTVKSERQSQEKQGVFTADSFGVWKNSSPLVFDGITPFPGERFVVLVKPSHHSQKKVCDAVPTESKLGTYSCGVANITLNMGNNSLNFTGIRVLVGDIPPQDGLVDSYDISFIRNNLGSQDPNVIATGDVNYDQALDSQDFSLLLTALSIKTDEE